MIKVNNLTFSYTSKAFIENMSFSIQKGEIFGFREAKPFCGRPVVFRIQTVVLRDFRTHRDELLIVAGVAAGCRNVAEFIRDRLEERRQD